MGNTISSVFLSSRHIRKPELLEGRRLLEAAGFRVTSRWLIEERPADEAADPLWVAHTSWEDIHASDAYLLYGDARGDSGQRHVELGIAMALGKQCFVLAPEPENMWQRYEGVQVLPTWEAIGQAMTFINVMAGAGCAG